ncbi:major facilitator superfamily domain-containing protein [Lipomyces kononenkoae]|uniref:Major facilitator superfamily domain-containing protein n=1 Tax=Lipomyces kononenkoae TaxID=34357 RepID=A0ACC3SUW7_LIPKO
MSSNSADAEKAVDFHVTESAESRSSLEKLDRFTVTSDSASDSSLAKHGRKQFFFWQVKGPSGIDLDSIATQNSVFDDPALAKHYQPCAEYENLHRFDPSFRWTWREELALLRKLDLRVMAFVGLMFGALQLDRGNISQANADNFLTDLHLSTNDFNNGNTIFTVCFLLSELPSQLISKKLGPDRWVPTQMVLWSIVAFSQFWLTGRSTFYATRALLGILQGGFIADCTLYLSYFYTASELPVRLAYFWASDTLANVIASFLGFGILHMRGVKGFAGWRWLFLIEGLITLIVGIVAYGLMLPAPTKSASWFRGKKGWFSEREELILVNRVLRDDPSKGDMHNRQPINWNKLWLSISDYDIWPIYIIGFTFGMSTGPVGTYLSLTLRSIGFSTFQTTLMGLPNQFGGLLTMLAVTYSSQRFNERSLHGMLAQLWVLPNLIALHSFSRQTNKWSKYAVTTILLSHPSTHAVQVAWTSRNSNSVRSRTVSSAVYNMACQLGGIISNYIYRSDDAPLYKRGNQDLIAICCMNVFIYLGVKGYYILRNRSRDRKWNALSKEEQEVYLATTNDKGNKKLDFRFAH